MGFSGTFVWSGGVWRDAGPSAEPWLSLSIHDSDIATIGYAPAGDGSGEAFLGITPRIYFEDDAASAPTDVAREARALAVWARNAVGTDIVASAIEWYLAADEEPPDGDDIDDVDLDDADIFVEIKSARFIAELGLAVPSGLPTGDVVSDDD